MSAIGSLTSSSQIWQQFISKTDTNDDGSLDVSELAELIGGDDSTSEATSIIDQFDSDADGTLSEEEFNAAVGGSNLSGDFLSVQEMASPPPSSSGETAGGLTGGPSGGPSGAPAGGPPGASASSDDDDDEDDLFSSLDTNGDGVISQEEFDAQFGVSESDSSDETSDAANAQILMDLVKDVVAESDASSSDDEISSAAPPPPPPPSAEGISSEGEDGSEDTDKTTLDSLSRQSTEQTRSASDMLFSRMMDQLYQQTSQLFQTQTEMNISI
nr:EF-hand domain-containing protein [uncultured Cohaesibacter sp.]